TTDADNDTLAYSATGLPTGLDINPTTGEITGTLGAHAGVGSPYHVTVSATDGFNTGTQSFDWTVNDTTTPSVTDPGAQSNDEGDVVSLAVITTDSDSDPLTYSADGLPAGLSINSSTGVISGTVDNQAASADAYSVTVTADDGFHTDTATF